MNNQKIRAIGAGVLVALWAVLTGFAWFSPAKDRSEAERRPLAQMPAISVDAVFGTDENGNHAFMTGFESYSLDQFPLRDSFRGLKALFHNYVLQQSDNNGYYYKDGYLAKQDLTLDTEAVQKKLDILNKVHHMFISQGENTNCYVSIVPDKSYYLAQLYGYPSVDFHAIAGMAQSSLPWASYVDITDTLELGDYYRTDTHWRQENLIPTAQKLASAMGVAGPEEQRFTAVRVDKPFYGVYHAQAALPVAPDDMYILESNLLEGLTVQVDGASKPGVYDMTQLDSDDQYNIYLSGAKTGMVTIENPNAATDKKLVVFRDSFGSSIAPLFIQDYQSVTLIDLRVFSSMALRMVDFSDSDVLVLLSSLALNNADEAFR